MDKNSFGGNVIFKIVAWREERHDLFTIPPLTTTIRLCVGSCLTFEIQSAGVLMLLKFLSNFGYLLLPSCPSFLSLLFFRLLDYFIFILFLDLISLALNNILKSFTIAIFPLDLRFDERKR
jgi:hypothetical protein